MLDGVDLHGKWPRGGGGGPVTFEHYLSEVPLLDHKCHESWRDRLAGLRNVTVSLGRPDFMLMNNEFGLGKSSTYVLAPLYLLRYTCSAMLAILLFISAVFGRSPMELMT